MHIKILSIFYDVVQHTAQISHPVYKTGIKYESIQKPRTQKLPYTHAALEKPDFPGFVPGSSLMSFSLKGKKRRRIKGGWR